MGDSKGGGQQMSAPANADTSSMDMDMMMQLMTAMSSMSQPEMPATPPVLKEPPIQQAEDIDWTEMLSTLSTKARADQSIDAARKKGRSDTIHSSQSLLDEEPTTSNKSLLSGAKK